MMHDGSEAIAQLTEATELQGRSLWLMEPNRSLEVMAIMSSYDEKGLFYARFFRRGVYSSVTVQQALQSHTQKERYQAVFTLRNQSTVEMRIPIAYFAACETANHAAQHAAKRLEKGWNDLARAAHTAHGANEILRLVEAIIGPEHSSKRVSVRP